MPRLFNVDTDETIGEISEEQLQFLVDNLEEEDAGDRDYYINRATIELLKEQNGPPALIAMLEQAIGDGDDVDIGWE
jgi:hypothetical protein